MQTKPQTDLEASTKDGSQLMSQAATDRLARKRIDTSTLSGGLHEKIRFSFGWFTDLLGGYGEGVSDPIENRPALRHAHESVSSTGRSTVVNIWVGPDEYAPGTNAQTTYN